MAKTYSQKPSEIERRWLLVDASEAPVGRIATQIATYLTGKYKPTYTAHIDGGDYVVVINAKDAVFTGNKETDKKYYRHTGFPGGIKEISFEKLIAKAPERVLEAAVKGMLPRNPLGRDMYRKLKVYAGTNHPHAAQQPQELKI